MLSFRCLYIDKSLIDDSYVYVITVRVWAYYDFVDWLLAITASGQKMAVVALGHIRHCILAMFISDLLRIW